MKEEIEDRLEDLSENMEQLSRLQSKTEEDLGRDKVLKAGIERLLQVSIETRYKFCDNLSRRFREAE